MFKFSVISLLFNLIIFQANDFKIINVSVVSASYWSIFKKRALLHHLRKMYRDSYTHGIQWLADTTNVSFLKI